MNEFKTPWLILLLLINTRHRSLIETNKENENKFEFNQAQIILLLLYCCCRIQENNFFY
jgi:hypothetical protein